MSVWHAKSARQTLEQLETDKVRGLSGEEAERRLGRYGLNRLQGTKRESLPRRFFGQMKDPMILVLLAAAALSLWASGGEDWLDAVIILVIVVVNACISISQEDSAERALEALRRMSAPLARVVRDGRLERVEAADLVPGDIIRLEAGDLVPADTRILESAGLTADESAMTGESVPVSKGALGALPEDTPLADRKNMLLSATVITAGRAAGVVVGTGMDTEVGRIAGLMLGEESAQTPLQKKNGGDLQDAVFPLPVRMRGDVRGGPAPGQGSAGHVPHRGLPGGGRDPGGTARHCHHCAGLGRAADGKAGSHCKAPARGGDPGLCQRDLFGQDGHPHPE